MYRALSYSLCMVGGNNKNADGERLARTGVRVGIGIGLGYGGRG